MKTAEEILFNHISKDVCVRFQTGMIGSIVNAMKEYAQLVTKQALENASESLIEWSYEKHPNFKTAKDQIKNPDNIPTI